MRGTLSASTPIRRIPSTIAEGRLLGGLDLAGTLKAGRTIAERGVLAEADGGVVIVTMAERMGSTMAAHLGAVVDTGEATIERDGIALRLPARIGIVALDEGIDDECSPSALLDRLAFHIDLGGVAMGEEVARDSADIANARSRLAGVTVAEDIVPVICEACIVLGISSLRAPLLTLRAARALAALAGRLSVSQEDTAEAAALVLAPRATTLPAERDADQPDDGESRVETDSPGDVDASQDLLRDSVIDAAQAAIPAGLLRQLRLVEGGRRQSRSAGQAGALKTSLRKGRPAGVRQGEPRAGARLNIIETLRAAAPWQPLRQRARATAGSQEIRIEIRRDDFRITRRKQREETTTIFVVDASGSAALHRLAEVKGAVELLLAECYVRRDRVALIAFRGRSAELVLPPTRSLARAKRSLAGLPGGGGTPLATALETAAMLADGVRRRGQTPIVVLLTDGRANVARDGRGGREQASADALAAARVIRIAGFPTLFVDASPQPHPSAQRLATEMAARYLALPHADAGTLSRAVQSHSSWRVVEGAGGTKNSVV
jgi:magnesium chelatase subunit D